jgi:HEAT repeat protein
MVNGFGNRRPRREIVAPELVRLLSNEKLDANVRADIAETIGKLGEHTVVSALLHLLSNENRLDADVRRAIARTVGVLAEYEVTIYTLAKYLKTSDIADHIYNALWNVSRRAGVRIFTNYGSDGKEEVEVVKW